jgi:hypothetical protein
VSNPLNERYKRLFSEDREMSSKQFLDELRTLANNGHVDAAQGLADELALSGSQRDTEEAYKWYYISLSKQGYSVGWEDHNRTPPHYCGPIGDFRNESMVSELVVKLGWEKVRQLDQEVAQWLAEAERRVTWVRFWDWRGRYRLLEQNNNSGFE